MVITVMVRVVKRLTIVRLVRVINTRSVSNRDRANTNVYVAKDMWPTATNAMKSIDALRPIPAPNTPNALRPDRALSAVNAKPVIRALAKSVRP